MKLCVALWFLVVCGISFSVSKRYDGYKLYRVTFEKGREGQLQSLVEQTDGAEIWMLSLVKGIADVFVAPKADSQLLTGLRKKGLTITLLNDNVQGVIDGTVVTH